MRRLPPIALVVAVLAALLLASPGTAGKPRKVALGDYEATLDSPPARGWVFGRFAVAKSGKGRAIVPSAEFGGIYYPDANECEKLTAPLVAQTVPINRRGRFRVRERTQADEGDLVVIWAGRWSKPRMASGSIVVRYGDCVSRKRWSAGPVR